MPASDSPPHRSDAASAPRYLGRHLLAELYGCEATLLASEARIAEVMLAAARACGATVVESVFHHFSPLGVSGVVIIAESHLTIHTWPEHGYAAVDVFTCGVTIDPLEAVDLLQRELGAGHSSITELNRGAARHLRA